jgi:phage gpG-like protein
MANNVTVSVKSFNRIPAIARSISTDSDRIVGKVAFDVQAEVLRSMEGAKSGRYYSIPGVRSSRKGGGGRRHRASAPGQAPARVTGALAGSVGVQRSFNRAIVYVSSKYAPHLEYGTVHMAARPFLRPAAKKFQDIFQFAVEAMLRRAVSGK